MIRNFLILAAATFFGAAAQDAKGIPTAAVGFPFVINGRSMPAGQYTVVIDDRNTSLRIRETNTGKGFFVTGAGSSRSGRTFLNFNRYGDRFVLRSVTHNAAVLPVPQSRRDTEIATAERAESVVVAAE